MKIDIPNGASFIISRLEENGKRADIVGGPVRDALLGKIADDFDITTSATPDEVVRIFADCRVIKTGIAHGTVTVMKDGVPYEVTTYRIDGEYTDNRHPDSVKFTTDIKDDLSRRDFTVNAMAYSPRFGLTDAFGGREDLNRRIIRTVGDPHLRFSEDALRILRAIRFSSVLGFSVDAKTAECARTLAPRLKDVSAERIYTEWVKLLSGKNAYSVILDFSDIISVFLPEISEKALPSRSAFDAASPLVKMLSLFAKSQKDNAPDAFFCATLRLKTDKKTRENGKIALEFYKNSTESRRDILHLLSTLGEERARLVIELRIALELAPKETLAAFFALIAENPPYKITDLAINGKDLETLGFFGKEIGELLKSLLTAVIDGELQNEKGTLLSFIKRQKR